MELEWRQLANCLDHDPELFFPSGMVGSADQIAEAKEVCSSCPVVSECLVYAVTTAQRFGVWGGTDEEERRVIRRRYVAAVRQGSEPDISVAVA